MGFRKSCFLEAHFRARSTCQWCLLPWSFRKSAWIRTSLRRAFFMVFTLCRHRRYQIVYHAVGVASDPWIARRADLHVVTIHDLIPERLDPPGHQNKTSAVFQRRESLRTAQGLIWVSKKTQREFRRFYPRQRLPGQVIFHGRPKRFLPTKRRARQKHFLVVGNRQGYKNAILVYRALALFSATERPSLQLVGGERPSSEELRLWNDLRIARWIRWTKCSEKELGEMYTKAIAVVVPSTVEGFGFPALEAMTYGRAVICLKYSGVDELVQKTGLVLKSASPAILFKAMKFLIKKSQRQRLEKKAARKAAEFDWVNTSLKTRSFYNRLLKK